MQTRESLRRWPRNISRGLSQRGPLSRVCARVNGTQAQRLRPIASPLVAWNRATQERAGNNFLTRQVSRVGGWAGVFDAPAQSHPRRGVEDSGPATPGLAPISRSYPRTVPEAQIVGPRGRTSACGFRRRGFPMGEWSYSDQPRARFPGAFGKATSGLDCRIHELQGSKPRQPCAGCETWEPRTQSMGSQSVSGKSMVCDFSCTSAVSPDVLGIEYLVGTNIFAFAPALMMSS